MSALEASRIPRCTLGSTAMPACRWPLPWRRRCTPAAGPACPPGLQWNAIIFGPDGTVWDGGVFKLSMEFSEVRPDRLTGCCPGC